MKAPAFQFYPGDFLSSPDVQIMTAEEVGAYCLLLFSSWQFDFPGYLPDDEKRLHRLTRLTAKKWKASRELLLRKFPIAPDKPELRYNPRLVREAEKQAIRRERLADNGRKGGRPEKQLPFEEYQSLVENSSDLAEESAEKPFASFDKENLSNEKQLVLESKAIEKASNVNFTTSIEVVREAAKAATLAQPKKMAFAKSEKQLSAPPTLAEVQAYAAEMHPASPEAQAEATAFVDHFTSNGWRVGGKTPMVDWQASFRMWMRRISQFQPANTGQAISPTRALTSPKPNDSNHWG